MEWFRPNSTKLVILGNFIKTNYSMYTIDITKLLVARSNKNQPSYSLIELKTISKENKLKVKGTSKSDYITAITEYLNKSNVNSNVKNIDKVDVKVDVKTDIKTDIKNDHKVDVKIEVKRNTKYVMWRINPKQCNYSLLNGNGDLFSTAKAFVANYNLQSGDILCAVASGNNRKKGILGVWEITSTVFNSAIQGQPCWLAPYDESRKLPQYRIAARKIVDSNNMTGSEMKNTVGAKINNMPPTLLTQDEYQALHLLV